MDSKSTIEEFLNSLESASDKEKVSKLYDDLILVNESKAYEVVMELISISEDYKSTANLIFDVEEGRYVRGKVDPGKSALLKLQKPLLEIINIFENTPPPYMAAFNSNLSLEQVINEGYEQSTEACDKLVDIHTVKFEWLIKSAYKITTSMLDKKNSKRIKGSTDKHKTIVAYQVAKTIKNILKVTVSTTLDSSIKKNSKPTAALFCRLLRHTLGLANEYSYDMQELMSAGIELSKDTELP